MQDMKVALVGICMLIAMAAGAGARTLSEAEGPAELPPPGFTGKQYVDSRGCVFVRAGYDGRVTWVPRVDRRRNLLCGRQPTLAGAPATRPDAAALRAACDRAGGAARADLSHQGRRYAVRCRARPVPAATAPLRLEITPARLRIPPGYKPAYPHGRLNPHRGIGTPEGEARMNLIWTQTVPRRLVR